MSQAFKTKKGKKKSIFTLRATASHLPQYTKSYFPIHRLPPKELNNCRLKTDTCLLYTSDAADEVY